MTPRVALYTCVTGSYDPIRAPERVDPRVDYWCFTDARHVPAPWRRQEIPVAAMSASFRAGVQARTGLPRTSMIF